MTTPVITVCVYRSFLLLFPPLLSFLDCTTQNWGRKCLYSCLHVHIYSDDVFCLWCIEASQIVFFLLYFYSYNSVCFFPPISPLSPQHPLVLDCLQIDYSVPLKHIWPAEVDDAIPSCFVLSPHIVTWTNVWVGTNISFPLKFPPPFSLIFFGCFFILGAEFVGGSCKDVQILKLINISRALTREVKEGGIKGRWCEWAWAERGQRRKKEEGEGDEKDGRRGEDEGER